MPIVDPEKRKAYQREYARRYRQKHYAKARATQRQQWAKYRRQAIEALGGVCVRCGEADPVVLQVDHIDGDGAADRRRRGTWARLRSVPNEPEKYQLLCANCHARKTFEQGDHLPRVDTVMLQD